MKLQMSKRQRRALSVLVALLLVCSGFPLRTHAQDFEVCRMCGGSGDFHCAICGGKGEAVCDNCHGQPRTKCPGDGVHGCVDGYYTCPSCNGDTYIRSGDGEIPPDAQPGTCGNCGGTGKLRCIVCHTEPGWNICTRCDGRGIIECQDGNCKVSRQYGGKCPRCKGTGYILLGNPMPPESDNDGVKNVPKKGDYIVTNDKTWAGYRYGEDSQGGGGQGGGQDPGGNDPGGQGGQEPGGQEPGGPGGGDEPGGPGGDEPGESAIPIANGYDQVEDFPAVPDGQSGAVRLEIIYEDLNNEQKEELAAMPEEELQEILDTTKTIVSTAKPGTAGEGVDELLDKIAELNGFESPEDGRLFPIEFTGHQDLPFPVYVTVQLDKGVLDGGTDIYVYHLLENGEIEPLEKAQYWTYDDGSVQSIRFRTTGFSSFFTARGELNLDLKSLEAPGAGDPGNPPGNAEDPKQAGNDAAQPGGNDTAQPGDANAPADAKEGEKPAKSGNTWIWIGVGIAAVAAVGAGTFLLGRKGV